MKAKWHKLNKIVFSILRNVTGYCGKELKILIFKHRKLEFL